MYDYSVISLLFGFILLINTEIKGDYPSCPFADLQDSLHEPICESDSPPVLSDGGTSPYSAPKFSNLIADYGLQYGIPTEGQPITSYLQRHLPSEESSPYSEGAISENAIFKSYFDEPKFGAGSKCAVPPENCGNDTNNYYYRTIDGSCNNLQYPGFGMSNARYGRLLPPKYGGNKGYAPTTSSSGKPLPNSRLLSLSLYGEDLIQDDARTLAFMQWGQVVAHDISRLSLEGTPKDCCSKVDNKMCYPILLHPHGPIAAESKKKCLGFARANSDLDLKCPHNPYYAEKITVVTAYLDLSSVYGNTPKQSAKVREFSGGLLKTSFVNNRQWLPISMNEDGECGEDNHKCYSLPDRRNQFIPSITVIQTILLREHNRIACALAQLNPHYTDEKLYQEARKINIGQYQQIVYYEWLPIIVGPSYAYANRLIHYVHGGEHVNDYDDTKDPAPYVESAAAALRYGHTQVPGYFSLVTANGEYNETKRLSDYFEKPSNIDFLTEKDNFDSVVRGMVTQAQKQADANIDKEIKHFFNRKLSDKYGADLKSFDIQRARDYGMPSYNDLREYCGLQRAYDWVDFISEIPIEKIELMQRIYETPDDVDLSVGGALEYHAPEALLGPTFQCIVGRQFLTTRIADRFFFENENLLGGFSTDQLIEIRKASMSALFCNNGDYLQYIQPNSFIVPNPNNAIRSCKSIPQVDLSKWKSTQQETTY